MVYQCGQSHLEERCLGIIVEDDEHELTVRHSVAAAMTIKHSFALFKNFVFII